MNFFSLWWYYTYSCTIKKLFIAQCNWITNVLIIKGFPTLFFSIMWRFSSVIKNVYKVWAWRNYSHFLNFATFIRHSTRELAFLMTRKWKNHLCAKGLCVYVCVCVMRKSVSMTSVDIQRKSSKLQLASQIKGNAVWQPNNRNPFSPPSPTSSEANLWWSTNKHNLSYTDTQEILQHASLCLVSQPASSEAVSLIRILLEAGWTYRKWCL